MILDRILSQVAPYECLGCTAEGTLLCESCIKHVVMLPERCYKCQRISPNGRTCISCRSQSELYAARPYTAYQGVAKELVWRLKFDGVQVAADDMARLMAGLLNDDEAVIVHVPTATSRLRKRGYDQAQLIAKKLSDLSGMKYEPLLRRMGQHHQVGMGRKERLSQLAGAYRTVHEDHIHGQHILLVDDVLTTGATLEAAAKVMKAAGATRVSAVVFAQA